MLGNGAGAVAEADIAFGAPAAGAGGVQGDDGAGVVQLVGLVDEVELAAHPAHHPAILAPVGDDVAEQGGHHGAVDEAGVLAVDALLGVVGRVQLVGVGHAGHVEIRALLVAHLAQGRVEVLGADEEAAMGHRPVAGPAPQHACLPQIDKGRHQHFGDAVQALGHRLQARGMFRHRAQTAEGFAELGVARLARDQGPGHRVAQGADADLQGSAVLDPAGDVQGRGVLGQADRLARGGVERKLIGGGVQDVVEGRAGLVGVAQHIGQLLVHLAAHDQGLSRAALGLDLGQHVQADIGIAAEAVARRRTLAAPGHQLADDIDALVVE